MTDDREAEAVAAIEAEAVAAERQRIKAAVEAAMLLDREKAYILAIIEGADDA
jgi:hypothetical protein